MAGGILSNPRCTPGWLPSLRGGTLPLNAAARLFSIARKLGNEERQVSFPHFLALAWPAANDKAKEIGWIP